MIQKNIWLIISVVVICSIMFFSFGNSNAKDCLNSNITLTNTSHFVCTSGWIKVLSPVELYNATLISKGIIINNTFELNGTSFLNTSNLLNFANFTLDSPLADGYNFFNKGQIFLGNQIFINFTFFSNYGYIYDQNYIGNGGKGGGYPYGRGGNFFNSYAGSGGGSIQNESAYDGGSTLAPGGYAFVLCHRDGCGVGGGALSTVIPYVNGSHVSDSLKSYTFNLSLLESAGGADFNLNYSKLVNGGSGVFPLIIISKNFANYGLISNEGQSINYSSIPDGRQALEGGVVGAGGGGIIEIIYGAFIANGTYDVSGGKVYISKKLNASLNMTFPDDYNLSILGDGGAGNVFDFRASSLLLNSLPSTDINFSNTDSNLTVNGTNNQTYTLNNNEDVNKTYSITANLPNNYGCNTNNIYINLTGLGNSTENYSFKPGQDFVFSSSVENARLYMSGQNPIINYYNKEQNITLGNKTYYFTNRNSLSVYLTVNSSNSLSLAFSPVNASGPGIKLNGSGEFRFSLPAGEYRLTVYNSTNQYNYSIDVAHNCFGYENISLTPGKPYYMYDGINVSTASTTFLRYKTKTINTSSGSVYYITDKCQAQNLSQLVYLDEEILSSLSSVNKSIIKDAFGQNYSSFLEGINLKSLAYNASNAEQDGSNTSLNQSGFISYYYFNGHNLTEGKFIMVGNTGTINISYKGQSIKLLISRHDNPSPFVTFESDFVRAIEYIPSAFISFFGVL